MPSYLTHAIMGEEVYKQASDDDLFKVPVNLDGMKTFSMGADLASFSKKSSYKSHNEDTQAFFLNMINYIKENNLREDEEVMATLYGHMAHYFLDVNCHPLVYFMEAGYKNSGKICSHTLIEGYMNYYFNDKCLNTKFMDTKSSYFNSGNINYKKNRDLIKSTYEKTYGDKHIMKSYNATLGSLTFLDDFVKSGMFTVKRACSITGFNKFLEENNIESIDLLNLDRNSWTNPVSGQVSNDSMIDLYCDGINDTLEAISVVNKCIYDDYSPSILKDIFRDLSYDTGVECSKGRKMSYVKRLS